MVTQRHGNYMRYSLEVLEALGAYVFVIRATNETGEFTRFYVKEPEVVVSRIMQEKEDITNISKGLFKALIANNMLEYNSEDIAFLVC